MLWFDVKININANYKNKNIWEHPVASRICTTYLILDAGPAL